MGIFPESWIDGVRRQLDAAAVVRKINYRPEMIQDTGQGIKCFCPIHKETIFRTLIVDTQTGDFRCSNFNCPGTSGGDLIELYARSCGLSYEQSLMELSRAFNITVDLSVADQYLKDALEVARNYLEMGVLNEAEDHFDQILRFKENCIPALEGLARIYEATERPDAFQTVRLQLAMALAAQTRYDEAIDLLQLYMRDNPHEVEACLFNIDCLKRAGHSDRAAAEYVRLADNLAARGEVDQALDIYRSAEALDALGLDVFTRVIALLMGAGRREEALAETIQEVGARIERGDPRGAVGALVSALDLDPAREELVLRLAEIVAQVEMVGEPLVRVCTEIQALLAARNHGPAAKALELLERAFPGRPLIMSLRADLEEARGNLDQSLELRLQCVDYYQQGREYEEALTVLEKARAGRTDNITLLSRKANLLHEMGRASDAVPIYLEIVDLFKQADEFEHAAAVYQTVIDLEPDRIEHGENQFDLYLLLGMEPIIVQKALALCEIYCRLGQLPQATNVLERAIRNAPMSPELLARHGEIFESLGRRGEAAERFLAVGQIFLNQNNLERAHQALEHSLKCVPEHLDAREALADVLAAQDMTLQAMGIYTDLAEFYLREKEAETVIRLQRKVLAIQPGHLPSLLMLSKSYGMAGQMDLQLSTQTQLIKYYMDGQSYTRATEICEEILSQHDDYTPALEQLVAIAQANKQGTQSVKYLWKLSQVHARGGRREQEQGILEQVLARDPLHAGACFRHLELLMAWGTPRALAEAISLVVQRHEMSGRIDQAIQILEDLRQTSSPKPEIFAGLARLYRAKGDTESLRSALRIQAELLGKMLRDPEALEVWNELVALQPDDMTILRTRVEIMLRDGMMDEAAEEYRRLALALIERRRYEEAEMALLEVLNLNARDLAARNDLISVFVKTRDFTRAAEQVEEAAGQLLEEGQFAEAIHIFERIFEFDSARDDIYRKIIAIRQRMGDLSGVLETFERLLDCLDAKDATTEFEQAAHEAIQLQPDSWAMRRRLADFYAYHSRPREAEGTLLTLAVRQIETGERAEGEKTLDKILEFNPSSVPARAHRAELLAHRGLTAEALNEFMSLTGSLAAASALGAIGDPATTPYRAGSYEGIRLIKDYTFETFIVGARNNFAYATAMAVCRAPAKNYNPLFLYSDVGLGKTHLCHAIAHYLIDRHPELKVLYTTTEEFVAELVDATQGNSITAFRNRHKLMDVLIIDDVQFLSGKERAQEEFFHVFNVLYQAGKQVILTSDRPPKDISHLEKRLKSRFGAGIIVDIQTPDLETRIAILRHEMAARGKEGALSDEVILHVAEQVESNVRDLKGVLNQLLARQDFSGDKIDLELAQQFLAQHLLTA